MACHFNFTFFSANPETDRPKNKIGKVSTCPLDLHLVWIEKRDIKNYKMMTVKLLNFV